MIGEPIIHVAFDFQLHSVEFEIHVLQFVLGEIRIARREYLEIHIHMLDVNLSFRQAID